MRIGLDVDGVIYDFTRAYNAKLQSLGHEVTPETEALIYDYYTEYGYSRKEFLNHLDEMVDCGQIFWTGYLCEPYIPFWIDQLREQGHTIHIITHRVSGKVMSCEEATKHFFREMKIHYDSLTFSQDKTSVPTDIFLEDHTSNYDALVKAGVETWLVNRPYNQDGPEEYRKRVASFTEFAEKILLRGYWSRYLRTRKFGLPDRYEVSSR